MQFVHKAPFYIRILLAGLLLGAGFLWAFLWPLSLYGVWLLVTTLESATTWSARISGATLAFVIKALCGIAWFWTVYPIEWLSITVSWWQLPAIGVGWLVSGVALGSSGILFGVGVSIGSIYVSQPILRYVLYAGLWLTTEVLGSLMFALVTYGEGGTITTAFSFGYLGYLGAYIPPLFALAVWGGVYTVTFTTVLLVLLSARMLTSSRYVVRYLMVGGIIGGLCVSFISTGERQEPPRSTALPYTTVAIIDTNFPGTLGRTEVGQRVRQVALQEAFIAAEGSGARYVLFPEDSGYTKGLTSQQSFTLLDFTTQLGSQKKIVIDSESVLIAEGAVLRAKVLDGQNRFGHTVDKQYLVPVGEFVPTYIGTPLFTALGWGGIFTALEQSVRYRPGPYRTLASELTHVPGILFCFEGVDPLGVAKLRNREVPFIAHPFSHGWFQSTKQLSAQLTMMLRLQARANTISIVSAGNQGVGAVYYGDGSWYLPPPIAIGERWRVRVVDVPIQK